MSAVGLFIDGVPGARVCTCACGGEGEGQSAGIWAEVCDKPPLNLISLPFIPQLCDLEHTGNLSEPLSVCLSHVQRG